MGFRDGLAVADLDTEEPGVAYVNAPYAANSLVKSLSPADRRWSSTRRVWVVTLDALPRLISALLGAGYLVDVWHDDEVRMLTPTRAREAA